LQTVKISDKVIGPGHPVFIIAEIGVNHNGEIELAKKLVLAAKKAGADAVKFQTFKADKLATAQAEKAAYQKQHDYGQEKQLAMLKQLELSEEVFVQLKDFSESQGILFLSTPFDEESADFLERIGIPAFKVSSGDLTNLPFLKHIAVKKKPLLLSTGMAYLNEIKEAVDCILAEGNNEIILFHCTSNYPPSIEDINLLALKTLRKKLNLPIGYSDHTLGDVAAVAAAALGAIIIEKHITLDCSLPGPDHRASMEPAEFSEMVKKIRIVERLLGSSEKKPVPAEEEIRLVARKSIVARVNITKGTKLTRDMLMLKRPGTGIPPKYLEQIIGCKVNRDIAIDETFTFECLEEDRL